MAIKKTAKKTVSRTGAAAVRKAASPKKASRAVAGATKKVAKTVKAVSGKKKVVTTGKSAAKKPAKKSPVEKKPSKKAVKKTTSAKPAAKPAVKPAAEKVAKKPAQQAAVKIGREAKPKAVVASTVLPPVRPDPRVVAHKTAHAEPGAKAKKLGKRDSESLRELLVAMRRRLAQQVSMLKDDSLRRNEEIITGEEGTDVFDRQFALNLASSEQEAIYDIDEALRRIEEGTYGLCEDCGCVIGIERLRALPFVRSCVQCQAEKERNRPRFRPFELSRDCAKC